jgi:hypothetical protein
MPFRFPVILPECFNRATAPEARVVPADGRLMG